MRTFLLVVVLASCTIAAPPPEVRGTWLTTTDNDALASPASTAATMTRLREIGLNTVYIECWKNGYTEFPSATLQKTIKITHKINLPNQPPTRDLLEESLIEAHRNQLLCFAWFADGFMIATKDVGGELRAKKPQWLLRDKDGGDVAPDGTVWMNPLNPEVRTFLLDIVVEALNRYDLDGVQLDDHFAWPDNRMGYDDYTKSAYAEDYGGPPPGEPDNAEWVRWRTVKLTEFAEQFHQSVRKARPDVLVSLSPSAYPSSAEQHAVDWPAWARNGWMDEFVPKLYRESFPRFAKDWPQQLDAAGARRRGDIVAALRIVGDASDTPWNDLKQMCELVRQSGGGGHCWWFSRGVLDVYPEQIRQYYAIPARGFAAHPRRDEGWRPPPFVGTKRGEHWSIVVDTPAIYQVIVKKNGGWSRLRIEHAQRGTIDLHDRGYEAVELLLDRRARR